MNTSLVNLKQQLLQLLPDGQSFIDLPTLKEVGFPDIIADRILLEISDEMYSLISRALTGWVNIHEEEYVRSTDNYLDSIIPITKIPLDVLSSYIERVINEIIEQCLQPRVKIPQQLFGADKSLNYEEIQYRSRYVMQHKTLVTAILRYMERKGLTELTQEQASDLIKKIDERLVATYTPEDWANALEMPFSMMEGRIESNEIIRYFEHRGAPAFADKFRGKTGAIPSKEFLDLLFEEPEQMDAPEEAPLTSMEPPTMATPPNISMSSSTASSSNAPPKPTTVSPVEIPEETSLLGSLSTPAAVPLWQRFLQQVPDEPTTVVPTPTTLGINPIKMSIQEWLVTDQASFVRYIFKGNREDFDRLLIDLEVLDDWNQAQDWLQARWLPYTEVDIEDELFVLFIDQLQSYFNYKRT